MRPWTDTQPDGFLSGNVKSETSYDVHEEPTPDTVHVVEYWAVTEAREQFNRKFDECEKLKAALKLAIDCLARISFDRGTTAGSTNARNFADRRETEEKIKNVLSR